MQRLLGTDVGAPSADSVSGIMANCSIEEPGKADDCAHDLGRLYAQSFDFLAQELIEYFPSAVTPEDAAEAARDFAFDDYYRQKTKELPHGTLATFREFHDLLGELILRYHIQPLTQPPPHYNEALTFEISPWQVWLYRVFFLTQHPPPHEDPH